MSGFLSKGLMKVRDKRPDALIGWYCFKGSDNTSGFAGKGISSYIKAFMDCDSDILDAILSIWASCTGSTNSVSAHGQIVLLPLLVKGHTLRDSKLHEMGTI